MTKKKKSNDPFKSLSNAALGLGGLGVATAVGAGIASHAPAGTPSLTQGFGTIAGFAPIAVTGIGASAVLKTIKKKKGGFNF